MSLDRADFAAVTQDAQSGGQQSFFPIVIDTSAMLLGQEREINITPVDSIWMPTCYDLTISKLPMQFISERPFVSPSQGNIFSGNIPYQPDSATFDTIKPSGSADHALVGFNMCDVYQNGTQVQGATIFSIRLNSPNNPWLLFGLSTLLGTYTTVNSIPGAVTPISPGLTAGQGGCMRSVTGPISRLWVKILRQAFWNVSLGTSPVLAGAGYDSGGSQIVMMSSLGFMQETAESVAQFDNSTGVTGGSFLQARWAQSVHSGGYSTPQLNSANKKYLGVR